MQLLVYLCVPVCFSVTGRRSEFSLTSNVRLALTYMCQSKATRETDVSAWFSVHSGMGTLTFNCALSVCWCNQCSCSSSL